MSSQDNSFSHDQHYQAQQNRANTSGFGHSNSRAYQNSQEGVDMHMSRCRSPHHQQTMIDGQVCALGNQNIHGNTWVMNGANWTSTRQASPH